MLNALPAVEGTLKTRLTRQAQVRTRRSHLTLELDTGRSAAPTMVITIAGQRRRNGTVNRTVKRTLRWAASTADSLASDFWRRQYEEDRGRQSHGDNGTAPPQGPAGFAPGTRLSSVFPRSLRQAPTPAPARLRRHSSKLAIRGRVLRPVAFAVETCFSAIIRW